MCRMWPHIHIYGAELPVMLSWAWTISWAWCFFWWGLGATVICVLQAWLDAGHDAGCACAYFTLDLDVRTDAP